MSNETGVAIEPPIPLGSGQARNLTDRFLSFFTEVHSGEGIGALLLAVNVYLLLEAYYILKTVREALILSEGSAEIKAYSSAAQAALLLLIIPAYGLLASKVNRERLITSVTIFFAFHLAIFYIAGRAGYSVGIVFFLWVGIFNLLVIAQFWALANDLYNKEQGKRLLPIVGIGSSLGAWLGSIHAAKLFPVFGTYGLMLIAGGLLLLCVAVNRLVKRFPKSFSKAGENAGAAPLGRDGAFRLILNSRYLFWIAMLVLVLNVVNTTGEFILSKLVVDNADRLIASGAATVEQKPELIATFYGSFFSWVNLGGMILQLFLVSRIFKYIGIRGALFILPVIAFASYGLVTVLPVLSLVRVAKVMENGTDYSIQNTARHALFLPTSREAKYKAQAAIESFFWRAGDVVAAGLVFIGAQFGFAVQRYAAINMACAVIWIVIVIVIAREHKKLEAAGALERHAEV
jgi:ATP:ADP antiporter, AAA family